MGGLAGGGSTPHVFDPARHCGAKAHGSGKPCTQVKGYGTAHKGTGRCKYHGGATKNGRLQASKEQAALALERFGRPKALDPRMALFAVVYEAAGNVAFLRAEVGRLDGLTLHSEGSYTEQTGVHVTTVREDAKAIVKLYGEWVDRLADYAAEAVRIGLDERMIELAEAQSDAIVKVVGAALDAAGVTGEARTDAMRAAAAELRKYATPAIG